MAKRVKIPGRLESAETGNIVTGADAVMDDEKGKTQVVINSEVDAAIINLAQGKQDNLTFDSAPTKDSPNPVTSAGVYTADKVLSDAIEAILLLIPSAASALNKLVDMQTMNSSIATATASFKGTYNLVSDLHLGVDATHEQIGAALDALSLGADNNDYAFVQVPNSATAPTEIRVTERYKFNGTNWLFEYDLNNSGFTQGQWNAINSGVTSLLVGKLSNLPTDAELTALLAGKQDNLTFDNVPTAGSPNPVKSGGVYARNNEIVALINALDAAKQDVLTFDNAPVEGSPNPVKSGGVYMAISAVQAAIVALDAEKQNVLTFDSTPTLGSANPVTSSGIKTELNRIDGNITTLNDLYEALTQSALVIVQPTDTWPVASPATSTIYRVVDRVNTPPQNYSDYMWNGTTMVLMAQYDNAIDPVPVAGSNNLVKSGGVYSDFIKYDNNSIKLVGVETIYWVAQNDGTLRDTLPNDFGSKRYDVENIKADIKVKTILSNDVVALYNIVDANGNVLYWCGPTTIIKEAIIHLEDYPEAKYVYVCYAVSGKASTTAELLTTVADLEKQVNDIPFKPLQIQGEKMPCWIAAIDGSLRYTLENSYGSRKFDVEGLMFDIRVKTKLNASAVALYNILDENGNVLYWFGTTDVNKEAVIHLSDYPSAKYVYVSYDAANCFATAELTESTVELLNKEEPRKQVSISTGDTEIEILTKLIDAFNEGNCDVIWEHGTYTFSDVYLYMRDTLGWTWTMELPIGGNCRYFFNGSTLISNAPTGYGSERSLLGCKGSTQSFELHDGVLVNNEGTYVVHDEGNNDAGMAVHRYDNIIMKYNTVNPSQQTGRCLGMGANQYSIIELNNCVLLSPTWKALDWHGNANTETPLHVEILISNCYSNSLINIKEIRATDYGRINVNNCNFNSLAISSTFNEIYEYNNIIITQ